MAEVTYEMKEYLKLLSALKDKRSKNKLASFKFYEKQREFINSTSRITALFGGNQVGKSTCACALLTYHLTGDYPEWYEGIRYDRPVDLWVAGETSTRVRDTLQQTLFGRPGQVGTGVIPGDLVDIDSITRKAGIPHAIDFAYVKHTGGGLSSVQFFSYEMGREKFQGSTIDLVLFDEEPPIEIVNECKIRIMAKKGRMFFAFTPLKGLTPLYNEFIENDAVHKVTLTMDDAPHISKDEREALLSGMSPAERMAREYGVATVGSGQVFQFQQEEYLMSDFEIPSYWPRVGGFDVGIRHPTGAVAVALDRNTGSAYVYKEYQVSDKTAIDHAKALRNWKMRFAADPSAWNRNIGTCSSTAKIYIDEGMDVFKANNDREASIHKIRLMIQSGKLKIFNSCKELTTQMRLYRTREDGTIIKERDDLIDPLRYAIMAIEKADSFSNGRQSDEVVIVDWKPSSSSYGY